MEYDFDTSCLFHQKNIRFSTACTGGDVGAMWGGLSPPNLPELLKTIRYHPDLGVQEGRKFRKMCRLI